jgi:hypothetical protein
MLFVIARSPGTIEGGCCWTLLLHGSNLPLHLAKSAMVGSAMGKETKAVKEEGEDGGMAAGTTMASGGGGAGVDEDR